MVFIGSDLNVAKADRCAVNAVNSVDGTKLWSFPLPPASRFAGCVISSPTLSSDGKVAYVGSSDFGEGDAIYHANLYALKAVDGTKLWNFTMVATGYPGSAIIPVSSPTLSSDDKVVYVGSGNYSAVANDASNLYAVHASNGTQL
jgi:outer membrane protein assembly factor BamB